MSYIRYQETEQLFKAWPLLEAIQESLKQDLIMAQTNSQRKENMASEDDYIYSLVLGNQSLNDAPPAGKISDSTGNIAGSYKSIMDRDQMTYIDEWQEFGHEAVRKYLAIDRALGKIGIAFSKTTKLQQQILKLYYHEDKVWKEVLSSVGNDKSESTIKTERKRAISTMEVILKNSITFDAYESLMDMVSTERENDNGSAERE